MKYKWHRGILNDPALVAVSIAVAIYDLSAILVGQWILASFMSLCWLVPLIDHALWNVVNSDDKYTDPSPGCGFRLLLNKL